MGHHRIPALLADSKRRLQFLRQQKGVPMPVPRGPHDATAEIELDMVDAVLNLLTNGFDEAIRAVAGFGEFSGKSVPSSSGKKIAAGKDPRTDRLTGVNEQLNDDMAEVWHYLRAAA